MLGSYTAAAGPVSQCTLLCQLMFRCGSNNVGSWVVAKLVHTSQCRITAELAHDKHGD